MDHDRRLIEARGDSLAEIGARLGQEYRVYIDKGLKRSRELYEAPPVTVDQAKWTQLAKFASDAAAKCCPHAHEFLQGISTTLKSDVYHAVLDFEADPEALDCCSRLIITQPCLNVSFFQGFSA